MKIVRMICLLSISIHLTTYQNILKSSWNLTTFTRRKTLKSYSMFSNKCVYAIHTFWTVKDSRLRNWSNVCNFMKMWSWSKAYCFLRAEWKGIRIRHNWYILLFMKIPQKSKKNNAILFTLINDFRCRSD